MTQLELDTEVWICNAKIKELEKKAPGMRKEFLQELLSQARARQDEEKASILLRILQREFSKKR